LQEKGDRIIKIGARRGNQNNWSYSSSYGYRSGGYYLQFINEKGKKERLIYTGILFGVF
jgi:hypothetical protein